MSFTYTDKWSIPRQTGFGEGIRKVKPFTGQSPRILRVLRNCTV